MILEIAVSITVFTLILSGLVGLILATKACLLSSDDVVIEVNEDRSVRTEPGEKLMNSLASDDIFISSACGGGGTCGQCIVNVLEGGGEILPTELIHISRRKASEGARLACQLTVRESMKIQVPPEVLTTRRMKCRVRSNNNLAVFIKELVLEIPEGEQVDFKAGGYVQLEAPAHDLYYRDFNIEQPYAEEWTKDHIWDFHSVVEEPVVRAYSMANYPGEKGLIILNVRIAFPPPGAPPDAVPGRASSYIFSLEEGDEVSILGPYGDFNIHDSDSEMIYIGGGSGMAPLRSHIFQLLRGLNTKRRVSFWYGARNTMEIFYQNEFEQLEKEFPNFTYHPALSRPGPEDQWDGSTGYIANVLYDQYLKNHPSPEDVEYYICGPQVMTDSILHILDHLGVEPENIFYDDFGL